MDREMISRRWKELVGLVQKYRYLLLVICCGVILMLLPRGGRTAEQTSVENPAAAEFSLEEEERRMEQALSLIRGVGRVRVVLTLKSTMETVYQSDLRSDESKGETNERREGESDTVIVSAGSGIQQPVARKHLYPVYQGALVVCDGGDSAEVKLCVVNAMSALTGLAANRITVVRYE